MSFVLLRNIAHQQIHRAMVEALQQHRCYSRVAFMPARRRPVFQLGFEL
jgi:hypothetical protein